MVRALAPTIGSIADMTVDEREAVQLTVPSEDAGGQMPAMSVVVARDADGRMVDPADDGLAHNGDGTGDFCLMTDATDAGACTARGLGRERDRPDPGNAGVDGERHADIEW